MEGTKHKPDYILDVLFYAFILFILFMMEMLKWYFVLPVTIVILAHFYKEEYYIHKIERIRKKKIFELLKEKYTEGKPTASGNYEAIYNGVAVHFSFSCISTRSGISNDLKIFYEITNLDDRLKNLCKIHFYYEKHEGRDWIHVPFKFSWKNSIKSLVQNSESRILQLKSNLEAYIEEKSLLN